MSSHHSHKSARRGKADIDAQMESAMETNSASFSNDFEDPIEGARREMNVWEAPAVDQEACRNDATEASAPLLAHIAVTPVKVVASTGPADFDRLSKGEDHDPAAYDARIKGEGGGGGGDTPTTVASAASSWNPSPTVASMGPTDFGRRPLSTMLSKEGYEQPTDVVVPTYEPLSNAAVPNYERPITGGDLSGSDDNNTYYGEDSDCVSETDTDLTDIDASSFLISQTSRNSSQSDAGAGTDSYNCLFQYLEDLHKLAHDLRNLGRAFLLGDWGACVPNSKP